MTTDCGDDTPATGGSEPQGGASSTQGGGGSGGAGSTGGGGSSGLQIEWVPCPLSSDSTTGDGAFCATIPVPLDWNDPTGETIDFFVKKIPATDPVPRGQLWFLNGGPGHSGAAFEGAVGKTVDLYLPDHRGTGRSSRLSCPDFESDESDEGFWVSDEEFPECAEVVKEEWGSKLDGFTITNAARDIGEVIAAISKPDDDILINGGSYGAIWGNRYLQLYPDQADGVVLDAFAVGLLLTRDDQYFDELGAAFMGACGDDTACGSHFAGDPWVQMQTVVDDIETGFCPEVVAAGWTRAELHKFWAFFLYTWDYRSLMAPMVHRMTRCEPRDIEALTNMYQVFNQPGSPKASDRHFSIMLSTQIMLSELWEDPAPSAQELADFQANATIAHGIVARAQAIYDTWPRYPKDEFADIFAETTTPVLVVRGEYDFIPRDGVLPAMNHFSNGNNVLEIPGAPHNPYAAPPIAGATQCGVAVRTAFFGDPTTTLDLSCTSEIAPVLFEPPADLSSAAFGTTDPWDGTPPGTPMNLSGQSPRSGRSPGRSTKVNLSAPTAIEAARAFAAWRNR